MSEGLSKIELAVFELGQHGKKETNFSHYKNNNGWVYLFLRALQAKWLKSEWNYSLAKEKHSFKKKEQPYSREFWG